MNEHDAISDDPERVECCCGRVFEGPKARDSHLTHYRLEGLRAALKEAEESSRGDQ